MQEAEYIAFPLMKSAPSPSRLGLGINLSRDGDGADFYVYRHVISY